MIRRLTGRDAAIFRILRLRALKQHGDAFLMTHAEQAKQSMAETRKRLDAKGGRATLGAFVDGELAGIVGFYREEREKVRHKTTIWGMYVAPEHRGRGLGRALMQEALRRIRAMRGVEQVQLAVITVNRAAMKLYRSMGFRTYGWERHSMRLRGRWLDEEQMACFLK